MSLQKFKPSLAALVVTSAGMMAGSAVALAQTGAKSIQIIGAP